MFDVKRFLVAVALLLFVLSVEFALAQHGQTVHINLQGKKLVVSMSNFPFSTLTTSDSMAYWRLVDAKTTVIKDMQNGTHGVSFNIKHIPDGEYYVANDYHIWWDDGKQLDWSYEYRVHIPIRISTVDDKKRLTSDSLASDGRFLGSWYRQPRMIGRLKVEVKQGANDILVCTIPTSDSCLVVITDLFGHQKPKAQFGQTKIEMDVRELKPSVFCFRAFLNDWDFYETVKILRKDDGKFVLEDPI